MKFLSSLRRLAAKQLRRHIARGAAQPIGLGIVKAGQGGEAEIERSMRPGLRERSYFGLYVIDKTGLIIYSLFFV